MNPRQALREEHYEAILRSLGEAVITTDARGRVEFFDPAGRGETVLLVEDEKAILGMGREMLETLGYAVLAAASPGEALSLVRAHPGSIHVLMTDVVMPGMNGKDLAARVAALKPGIKCLFMSGYTADVIAHRGVLDEGVHFLQKPFSVRDLSARVREALGASSGDPA